VLVDVHTGARSYREALNAKYKMRSLKESGDTVKLQRRRRLWQKRKSPINGIGLFAALPIRAGAPIIEFKGRVIPWEKGAVMLLRGANHVIKFDAKHDMDARPQWSAAGHVNHGCYPNCAIKKKRGALWLTSIRPIEQGEELLINYGFELGEEFEPCRCGHPRCSGLMLRRKDWPKLRRIMSKLSTLSAPRFH
jgi:SET domain-containing protein